MKKFLPLLLLSVILQEVNAQNTYNEITLPALMKKRNENASNMVIVDVRSNAEYYDSSSRYKNGNIGRIKDVLHIELQELEKGGESLKQLEPYRDKDIYLICSHSYRSRNASNILTRNGFKNVNNVQGGMTEWYRRYEDLLPYRSSLETSVKYKNISSAQLHDLLANNSNFLLIGINIVPRTWWDSATARYNSYMPNFKKAVFYNDTDSAKILELAKKNGGRPIVLFNNYSMGAAEIADYLAAQGIPNVQYLVGGTMYFHEYLANKNLISKAGNMIAANHTMRLITPAWYCSQLTGKPGTTIIDLRHDTLFNKTNRGIRNDFTRLNASTNFPFTKTADEFVQAFPDKKPEYVFVSRNGMEAIDLAENLSQKGYKINWLIGGFSRYDWYTINVENFNCRDHLLRP